MRGGTQKVVVGIPLQKRVREPVSDVVGAADRSEQQFAAQRHQIGAQRQRGDPAVVQQEREIGIDLQHGHGNGDFLPGYHAFDRLAVRLIAGNVHGPAFDGNENAVASGAEQFALIGNGAGPDFKIAAVESRHQEILSFFYGAAELRLCPKGKLVNI